MIEVVDPDGPRAQFALDGGPDGASVSRGDRARRPTSRARAPTLGALLLGGNSWATLAEAGAVDEHTPGAVAQADAMFATAPAPATMSWF